jgi:tetratricopeptide (TPR) repeat protein
MLDWAEAAEMYDRALALAPDREDARQELARSLLRLGQADRAEVHLKQLIQTARKPSELDLLYAECLAKLGKADEAIDRLEQLLKREPDHVDALLALGNLHLAAGRSGDALEHLQRAAELKPENREVVYAHGRAHKAQGQNEQARVCFQFVDQATQPLIELKNLMNRLLASPEDLDLRFQVAYITWKYKSREDGEKWFRSLLNLAPNHEPTHAALAIHYRLAGDQQRSDYHKQLAGSIDVEQFFQETAKPDAGDGPAKIEDDASSPDNDDGTGSVP